MEAIQAYYDGSVFVPTTPVKAKLNQLALITIIETANTDKSNNNYTAFFGALSADGYLEITEALKDTEKVDTDEW